MKHRRLLIGLAVFSILLSGCGQATSNTASAETATSPYEPVHDYDPARDAAADIQPAIAEADRTGRRVLVEVGGEWCIWCHYMDDFFAAHPDLTALRDDNFVTLKLNFSEENENQEALSQYPEITGYPHIFILDPHSRAPGYLIHSQNTADLEDGGSSYDLDVFREFLKTWSRA